MVIFSTISIGNLVVFESKAIRILDPFMSYQEYKEMIGGDIEERVLSEVEKAWFSVIFCEEIQKNQLENYVQKQMDYLYQVWYESGGVFVYDGINKLTQFNSDTQTTYDFYSLRTKEYDANSSLNKQTFLQLNKRLEADVRYCLEGNLEQWKKQNLSILEEYPQIKKVKIEKTQKENWIKQKKTYQSYPVHGVYEQYRDMDQRGMIIQKWIDFDGVGSNIAISYDMKDSVQYYDSTIRTWLNETFEQIFLKNNFAFGVEQSEYEKMQERELENYKVYQKFYYELFGAFILCLFSSFSLIIIRWKETEQSNKNMNIWSKVGTEVQGFLSILFLMMVLYVMEYCLRTYSDNGSPSFLLQVILSVFISCTTLVVGNCILSQVQLLKQRQWLQGFVSIRFFWKYLKTIWNCQSFRVKALVLIFVLPCLCSIRILIPAIIVFLLFIMSEFLKGLQQIEEGVVRLKEGELEYKIQVEHEGTLKKIADNINTISEGLQVSIKKEIQSERMKTELISNVSHDIKTPLTSIITYIDLLKQEKIKNDIAKDYILVLEQKANRLKLLTDDLFEAAKASSGDMPVQIESVHVQSLIQQTLGEYGEKLEQKGFLLRVQMVEEPLYIKADGKLMWRVLSNLLSNVIKYSVPYSRVYFDIEEDNEYINICIKNISEQELNISADELMERFVRGDDSRGTEGSGLGLNIANSLVQLQNGCFKIEIDGDLFKVLVQMPKDSKR